MRLIIERLIIEANEAYDEMLDIYFMANEAYYLRELPALPQGRLFTHVLG